MTLHEAISVYEQKKILIDKMIATNDMGYFMTILDILVDLRDYNILLDNNNFLNLEKLEIFNKDYQEEFYG